MAPYASWGLAASKTRSFRDDATDLGSHLRTGVYQDLLWLPFRKSCHDALRQLNQEVMSQPVNWIVDLDLAQFFDTMPHLEILTPLQQQIKDRKFLQLVARMLKGVQTPGGLCRVNWEVRKARLSPRCWRIYSWIARPMVYDRGETALPRILCVDPVCRR